MPLQRGTSGRGRSGGCDPLAAESERRDYPWRLVDADGLVMKRQRCLHLIALTHPRFPVHVLLSEDIRVIPLLAETEVHL